MAIRVLLARERDPAPERPYPDLYYLVWLDDGRSVGDRPDPAYLREYRWPATPPPGVALPAYHAQVLRETKGLAEAELATLNHVPTSRALPAEGMVL
jgi:hypothetical protein